MLYTSNYFFPWLFIRVDWGLRDIRVDLGLGIKVHLGPQKRHKIQHEGHSP